MFYNFQEANKLLSLPFLAIVIEFVIISERDSDFSL